MPQSSPHTPLAADTGNTPDTQKLDSFSQLMKACGDPLRLQILRVLKDQTFGVLELTQLFGVKQSGMSHHLKVMSNTGLVEAQREGNAVFYRRPFMQNPEFDQEALAALFDLVDRFQIATSLQAEIDAIHAQRAVQSQAFFDKNLSRFKAQQELICDYGQYAGASLDLLAKTDFASHASVLEIGPGEGAFLKGLSRVFSQVYALDSSQTMLQVAQKLCAAESLNNINFILGDTQRFLAENLTVDAVVMNMVLHHVPNPADIFAHVANILKPGGVFVVCDLCRHNQEWAKTNCGDMWLGFEAKELIAWGARVGLQELDSLQIGLRNGFQIQLRKFIKPTSHLAVEIKQIKEKS